MLDSVLGVHAGAADAVEETPVLEGGYREPVWQDRFHLKWVDDLLQAVAMVYRSDLD